MKATGAEVVTPRVTEPIAGVPVETPLRRLIGKLSRFAGVGAISGAVYAAVTAAVVSLAGAGPVLASAIGYLSVLPLNFLLQRNFTFRSTGVVSRDLVKYLITQATNIALCMGAMILAVDGLGLHYMFGIFGAIVVVPLMTYFIMDAWVFRDQRDEKG